MMQKNADSLPTRSFVKRFAQIFISMGISMVMLFGAAGTIRWTMAWLYWALYFTGLIINAIVLMRINPGVIAERAEGGAGRKGWDRVFAVVYMLLALPGVMILSGLDHRYGWTSPYAVWIQVAALGVYFASFGIFAWGMAANKYFSTVVRIQDDRGHSVVSGGPYRFIRHPGYASSIIGHIAVPIALGSLWAVIMGALASASLVVRTVLEDRTLIEELPGYAEYARKTKYRLIPGIW